jgi:nitroreductase
MDVIEAIYQRRSVRHYKAERAAPELVDSLLAAAVQAPSAMNLQPWAFFVIEGRDALSHYGEHAKRHLLDEVLIPGSPLYRYRDQLADSGFDIFYGAPLLVVIAATLAATQSMEDCCMAAQNLMLAAHRDGLGTCCIGFARPWLNLPATKAELGIPAAYVPVLPIVLWYPKAAMPAVPRKRPEIHRLVKKAHGGSKPAAGEPTGPGPWRFEEPAATEAREDPGTNVAPSRYEAPLDPRAPTRTASLEACGPPEEDAA